MVKEIMNFIMVWVFTCVYAVLISPIVISTIKSRLACVGIWMVIIGIWGWLAGITLMKVLIPDSNSKTENIIAIVLGVAFLAVGVMLRF